MIEQIALQNFQSHMDTIIEFDKGITVIGGVSCAGKSSIMRSIKWVVENRPGGNRMVSYWNRKKDGSPKNETSATMVSNGKLVTRFKDSEDNGYLIGDQRLTTIGTDVPEGVYNSLQLNELNIQRQLDPHFLISMSAGEVAKYLNKLVRLDVIDEVLAKADKEQRETNSKLVDARTILDTAKQELPQYDWVETAEALITRLEHVQATLQQRNVDVHRLTTSILDYKLSVQEAKDKKLFHEAGMVYVGKLDALLAKQIEVTNNKARLVHTLTTYLDVQQKLKYKAIYDSAIQKTIDIDLVMAKYSRSKVGRDELISKLQSMKLVEKFVQLIEPFAKASVIITEIDRSRALYGTALSKITTLDAKLKEYAVVTKSLKILRIDLEDAQAEMPAVCPTCGQSICKEGQ